MADGTGTRTRIIVISLDESTERRRRFEGRAQNAAVAWSFVPAYTALHPALSYSEEDAIVAKGRPLREAELGCYSSHYAAWENLQADNCDQYIVLEDDVIVDWTFIEKIVDINFTEMGIQYLRLYYKWPARPSLLRPHFIEHSRSIVELSGWAYGAQAYLITRAGAKRLLDHCRVVRRPIDDEMDRSWVHGVRNLAIFPFPILEEAASSTIGGARFDTFSVPKHLRFKRLVTRGAERWRRRMASVVRRFRRLRARLRAKT